MAPRFILDKAADMHTSHIVHTRTEGSGLDRGAGL